MKDEGLKLYTRACTHYTIPNRDFTLQCFNLIDNQWVTMNVQGSEVSAILQPPFIYAHRGQDARPPREHNYQKIKTSDEMKKKSDVMKKTLSDKSSCIVMPWRAGCKPALHGWRVAETSEPTPFSVTRWLSTMLKHWRVETWLVKL